MKRTYALIPAIALAASLAQADTVVTQDGSTINGTILGIDDGKITVATSFAGEIVIEQSKIASFTTDAPIYLTVENGATYLGPVVGSSSGLAIADANGEANVTLSQVKESWQPGEKSPTALRQEAELAELQRSWAYQAAFDLTGKTGNSDATGLATAFTATLAGPDDSLEFFARINSSETDGEKSADDARGGVTYTNEFGDAWNWYVRSEAGFDAIKDIDLFFTAAAGFGRTFVENDVQNLSVRGGLGYTFEEYSAFPADADDNPVSGVDDPDFVRFASREETSSASLDFGLFHKYVFNWGTMNNTLTYNPTIDDFGNFRAVHDTSFDLPLKAEDWSIRIGLNNTYDSEAEVSGLDELDTTYYIRMILRWL